jgi:hypothetical protein
MTSKATRLYTDVLPLEMCRLLRHNPRNESVYDAEPKK